LAVEAGQVGSHISDGGGSATAPSRSSGAGSSRRRSPRGNSSGRPSVKRTAAAGLAQQSKTELLRRAAAIDLEGRTKMSKAQLVRAIDEAPARSG
jgi:DNA end-binding protein Ku